MKRLVRFIPWVNRYGWYVVGLGGFTLLFTMPPPQQNNLFIVHYYILQPINLEVFL